MWNDRAQRPSGLECRTGESRYSGLVSNPAARANSRRNFGNSIYLTLGLCQWQCLSGETLKAVVMLYLVSMPALPGEVKYPTQGVNV